VTRWCTTAAGYRTGDLADVGWPGWPGPTSAGASGRSALALLVASVALADDHDAAVATNHLALVTDLLDAGLNLHCRPAFSSTAAKIGADHVHRVMHSLPVRRMPADRPGSDPGPTPESGVDFTTLARLESRPPITCSGRRSGRGRGRRARAPRRPGLRAGCGCSAAASCR
jgi:hypothetical protein